MIIDRISEGVGKHHDTLDDYITRDQIVDGPSKVSILREYLNRRDNYGIAPVHLAAHNGDLQMIRLLCAYQCDPFLKTNDGLTVLHSAAEGDTVNVIYYFLKQYDMNVDVKDDKDCTPLHWAVIEGNEVAATYLLAFGADINAQDTLGNTPLHLSVYHAEKELNTRLTKILLLKGADRKLVNNQNQSARDVIEQSEVQKELVR